MFERYSEAARLGLFAARFVLVRRGGAQIEPEHLLLGLLHVRTSIAWTLLTDHGLDLPALEAGVPSAGPRLLASVEVPFSASCKAVLTNAAAEAHEAPELTTGHLLIGLLRDETTSAGRSLLGAGFTLDSLRTEVTQAAAAGPERVDQDVMQQIAEEQGF